MLTKAALDLPPGQWPGGTGPDGIGMLPRSQEVTGLDRVGMNV
jgi:hypothetical protein